MGFVSAGKNTLLLYVTVCKKVVPRLNKHDDVIEWNFMKIAPPEMKSWLRRWWKALLAEQRDEMKDNVQKKRKV